jgi:hypothetical protein
MTFKWINLASISPTIKQTCFRFPISVICFIFAALFIGQMNHHIELVSEHFALNALASAIYGGIGTICLKLYSESQQWSDTKAAIGTLTILALIAFACWQLFDVSTFTPHLLLSILSLTSLMCAPYIRRDSDSPSVWYFNYQTGVAAFFAVVSALIFGVGSMLTVASLDHLFELNIANTIYADIWVMSWLLLFPLYLMAHISHEFDFGQDACDFPSGIKFIANYLLLPLMLVYLLILYSYFLKISLQQQLPRGGLAMMIMGFGTVGVITKLLIYPIVHSGSKLMSLFDRYYFHALLIPIVMLFVAIGIRIADFGITEQRYIVVMVAVWLTVITLMGLMKKDHYKIKMIPLVLAILSFFSLWGPWGATQTAINSQFNRFEQLLNKHQLLVNGLAVKSTTVLSLAERKKISTFARYFIANETRIKRVNPWFKHLLPDDKQPLTTNRDSHYNDNNQILVLLNIDYASPWVKEDTEHVSFTRDNSNTQLADVAEFNYVVEFDFYRHKPPQSFERAFTFTRAEQSLTLNSDFNGHQITLRLSHGEPATIDLSQLFHRLQKADKSYEQRLWQQDSRGENSPVNARILVQHIKGKIQSDGQINIHNGSGLLMLRFDL